MPTQPPRPTRRSPAGRAARAVVCRPMPHDGLLVGALPRVDAGDAWGTPLLPGDSRSVDAWRAALFSTTPAWVARLLALRDRLVGLVGIATVAGTDEGRGPDAGFPLLDRAADELLVGVDDVHLSFRVSIRVRDDVVLVGTVVQVHNRLGRAYWAVVRWFHPVVVRSLLRRVPAPVA